ncbi:TfoX/Sxy family protein [Methylobacterium komagatae]
MATKPSTVSYLVEQTGRVGHVVAKKMFGEYGLYCDGKLVALVCDDKLFVKPTVEGRAFLGSVNRGRSVPRCEALLPHRW